MAKSSAHDANYDEEHEAWHDDGCDDEELRIDYKKMMMEMPGETWKNVEKR